MSVVSNVTVKVPATTANLGPGFDCIGAALRLYNQFKFTCIDTGSLIIQVSGAESQLVKSDQTNLLYQSFLKLYEYINQTPPMVKIDIELGVPLARGLGSSATAIVGGLMAANQFTGSRLALSKLIDLAIAIEGHPDNVVPAMLGGCRLVATSHKSYKWEICDITWHRDIIPVVAIPDFELSTSEARGVLPTEVTHKAAIFNTSHLGLLIRALATNREDWLTAALQDQLHQPYRQALIPGYASVYKAAMSNGAYGMVISGAGPTLLALVDTTYAQQVATAMEIAWHQEGVKSVVRSLALDAQGAVIL